MSASSFIPPGNRARWAMILLATTIVVDGIAIAFDFMEMSAIDTFVRTAATDPLDSSDSRQAVIGLVEFILFVATGVAFIRWFHAAYRNVAWLKKTELPFKPGWAIGGWFVPVLNLWRPKQIADDIWRGSDPDAPDAHALDWREDESTRLVTLWWIFWIVTSVVTNIAGRLIFTADTLTEIRHSDTFDIASLAIDIPAAVLAILVVRRITARQLERARRLGEREQGAEALA